MPSRLRRMTRTATGRVAAGSLGLEPTAASEAAAGAAVGGAGGSQCLIGQCIGRVAAESVRLAHTARVRCRMADGSC